MDQKSYIGKKIKELRKAENLTASELGSMLDPPRNESTVTSWERGRTQPDADTMIQLCIALKSQISDFYFKPQEYCTIVKNVLGASDRDRSLESHYTFEIKRDGYVDVPIYGEIAAGTPIEMMEIDDSFPCPARIKAAHPNCGWLKVRGDSYNRQIPDGYLALVDFDMKDPNEHDPFAVCVNGYSATIKKVKKLANGFELIPNSYDPTILPTVYDYNKDDTEIVTIIGQVVWATMPFDYEM